VQGATLSHRLIRRNRMCSANRRGCEVHTLPYCNYEATKESKPSLPNALLDKPAVAPGVCLLLMEANLGTPIQHLGPTWGPTWGHPSSFFRQRLPSRPNVNRFFEESLEKTEGCRSFIPGMGVPSFSSSIYPLWHQWPFLVVALACLIGEWGIRRWKGWP
jgi:hypothetical protein